MSSEEEIKFLNSDAVSDDFFIEIVESKLNIKREEFKLKLVLLSPAAGKNENYVAVLYRAKIKIEILSTNEKKSVDVILKSLLSTMPEMKEMGVFPRERFVYENILQSFEDIWLERAEETIHFGPRMIKSVTEPYEQIILDDLKAEGYKMLDRKVGANLDQTKVLLKKIAQFHAVSAVRYQKDGTIDSFLSRGYLLMTEDSTFGQSQIKSFHGFLDVVRNYGDCDEFADLMSQWDSKKLLTMFSDIAEPMRSGFQVLNHGDMWLNNMMFKLDSEGKTEDVKLIDFQMPYWGSPAGDLHYFLITSVADDIKIEHFDEFVAFYHENLVESLKKLKYDKQVPTLAEIHIDFIDKGWFASLLLNNLLNIIKDDSPEDLTIEMLMNDADNPILVNRVYNNENFKKAVKPWFHFLSKRGYFDSMPKK